jgi:hypothetical protein
MISEPVSVNLWNYIGEKVYNNQDKVIKVLLADKKAVYKPYTDVSSSVEFNEGAISNELEWAKGRVLQLQDQFDLNNAIEYQLDVFGRVLLLHRKVSELNDDPTYKERLFLELGPGQGGTPKDIIDMLTHVVPRDRFQFFDGKADTGILGLTFFGYFDNAYDPLLGLETYPCLTSVNYPYFEIWVTPIVEDYSIYWGYFDLVQYSYFDFSFLGSIYGILESPEDMLYYITLNNNSGVSFKVYILKE